MPTLRHPHRKSGILSAFLNAVPTVALQQTAVDGGVDGRFQTVADYLPTAAEAEPAGGSGDRTGGSKGRTLFLSPSFLFHGLVVTTLTRYVPVTTLALSISTRGRMPTGDYSTATRLNELRPIHAQCKAHLLQSAKKRRSPFL